jgi:predicted HD superfamily hydrolase involved in NAD metabolism
MDRNEALEIVREQLTEKRYSHTLGVVDTAVQLARKYNIDEKKAELAAIFHDYAKFRPKEELRNIILQEQLEEELLHHHHELWHAPVGAILVKREAGIHDNEILQAIRYHTTGHPQMTTLDKVVFLADYIEPGRSFPGVNEVRELAKQSLNEAVLQALKNTIRFLIDKRQPIYPDTFLTYNMILQVIK